MRWHATASTQAHNDRYYDHKNLEYTNTEQNRKEKENSADSVWLILFMQDNDIMQWV